MQDRTREGAWIGDWTAERPPAFAYSVRRRGEGEWRTGPTAAEEYRDLGLAIASGGLMSAVHIRRGAAMESATSIEYRNLEFDWSYVLAGSVTIEGEDGTGDTLNVGDSSCFPPLWGYRRTAYSADYEELRIAVPADLEVMDQSAQAGKARPAHLSTARPTVNRESEAVYVRGNGPRAFMSYRDLDTRAMTGGRIHIHVVRAEELPDEGITYHTHNMSQWFVELKGWMDVLVEGQEPARLYPGDFVSLGAGTVHAVPRYSEGHTVLELCSPAEYNTVDAVAAQG
jgi:quercetin dioxygenase-like cupin family protein